MTDSRNYWENYYRQNPDPSGESPFARFVSGFLSAEDKMYELGCGNGRDSVFFGRLGVEIIGFDQCEGELRYLNTQNKLRNIRFEAADFTRLGVKPRVNKIYSRFTLHSVSEEKEKDTLNWCFGHLEDKGLLFIEIRSVLDELCGKGDKVGDNEYFTTHYRRFVVFADFVQRIEEAGFSILYKIESKGLARYGSDDPVVIRVVAQRASN
jgi:cyclopropane fatty-acyl-phospholipid synthase-like methyltransferase